MILSSDYAESNSLSPTRHAINKGHHQIKIAPNKRECYGGGDDFYSESYEDFGDVEDVGVLTSDPDQREYERDQGYPISSSSAAQKAPKQFLI